MKAKVLGKYVCPEISISETECEGIICASAVTEPFIDEEIIDWGV